MPSTQPNILLIFTDQQRYDSIAALGNPFIKTPALDSLAAEGTSFDRCYTPSPVCVAARLAMITGIPPYKSGVTDNSPMPESTSFMQVLQASGYQTHGVGKMHFEPDPFRLWGFESRDTCEEIIADDDYRAFLRENGYGHVQEPHGVRSEYYYLPQPSQLPAHLHPTHWVADRSIDFLKRRDRCRPFFLWSSFIKPHPPFESPTPWNKLYRAAEMERPFRPEGYQGLSYWNRFQNRYKYRDAGFDDNLLRTLRAAYYAAISFIDYNVGRMLQELGDEIEDTLVLFTTDHGELLGDYGSFGKRCMLEPAAHIPLLVRWPGSAGAHPARCAAPVSLLDLFPTILAAAGCRDNPPDAEGADLARLLARDGQERHVFSQYSEKQLGLYLVTDGRWKYSYSAADNKAWLFDLHCDPRETRNLAYNPVYEAHTRRMSQALIDRFVQNGYNAAVDLAAGSWRSYPAPVFPDDPDYALLFQDPPGTRESLEQLEGYA